ncbi:hypothetical protein D3C77_344900 [compost metagenome]
MINGVGPDESETVIEEGGRSQEAAQAQDVDSSLKGGITEEESSASSDRSTAANESVNDGGHSATAPKDTVLPSADDRTGGSKKSEIAEGVESSAGKNPGSTAGADKPATTHQEQAEPESSFVKLTIVGSPDVGSILETIEVEIGDSKTVLDVLKKATRSTKMQMEYTGSGATAYVQGIDNLYEFDRGSGSGWMYSVNGKFPNRSAGVWPLKSGDHIRWLYTEDLGKDLGAGADDGLWDGTS